MPNYSRRAKYIAALEELVAHRLRRRVLRKMQGVDDAMQDVSDIVVVRHLVLIRSRRYLFRNKRNRGIPFDVFALDAPMESRRNQISHRIPHLQESEFLRKYRMTRVQFDSLLGLIVDHPVFNQGIKSSTPGRSQVPKNQLMVLLNFLGQESCTAALTRSTHFTGYGTMYLFCDRVVEAICSLRDKVVFWPDASERKQIGLRFKVNFGFPNCVGIGDGTLLPLKRVPQSADAPDYSGRKLGHSITMFIINDDTLRIRSYLAGWPGSVHDNRVFGKMRVSRFHTEHFSDDEYMLSDSAVENCPFVVSAFKKPPLKSMPVMEEKFNTKLARPRVRSEHTIGVLKGRFPFLKKICFNITDDPESMMRILRYIDCCVILHNLLIPEEKEINETPEWYEDDGYTSDADDASRVPTGVDQLDRLIPIGSRKDERRRRLQTYFEYNEYCL